MDGKKFIDSLLQSTDPRNPTKKQFLTDTYVLLKSGTELSKSQMEIINDNIDNYIQPENLKSAFLASLSLAAYINSCK